MSRNGYDNESPRYAVKYWRNVPTETENAMEDFLSWLEYDGNSPDIGEDNLKDVKALVDAYLGRDKFKQIEQGEQEMLDKWIKACATGKDESE